MNVIFCDACVEKQTFNKRLSNLIRYDIEKAKRRKITIQNG